MAGGDQAGTKDWGAVIIELEDLLRSINSEVLSTDGSVSYPSLLVKHDLDSLSSALTTTATNQARALAYIVLGKAFARAESSDGKQTGHADALIALLSHYTSALFSETASPEPVLQGLGLLKAVLEINPDYAGKVILTADGMLDTIMDMAELEFFSTEVSRNGSDLQPSDQARVQLAIADLVNAGCSVPGLRSILKSRTEGWLLAQVHQKTRRLPSSDRVGLAAAGSDDIPLTRELSVVCAVALTKLGRASAVDPMLSTPVNTAVPKDHGSNSISADDSVEKMTGLEREDEGRLSDLLRRVVIEEESHVGETARMDTITAAIEGLAYTSLNPTVKERLSLDNDFLSSLFALARQDSAPASTSSTSRLTGLSPSYSLSSFGPEDPKSTALAYGIAAILLNMVAKRPVMTEEQKQVEKLKSLANGSGKAAGKLSSESPGSASLEDSDQGGVVERLNSNGAVEIRIKRLLAIDVTSALARLAKTKSAQVKIIVGKAILELVREKENRITVIKGGGARVLLSLLGTLMKDTNATSDGSQDLETGTRDESLVGGSKTGGLSSAGLESAQALAKLLITTPPVNLFGQTYMASSLDCVRPLAQLLCHADSSLLQHFESLMGLTNLASISPEVADKIVKQGESFLRTVESDMLEDHVLLRRAAVELVCNLATSEEGFCRYSGEDNPLLSDAKEKTTDVQIARRKAAKSRLRILLALTDDDDPPTRLAAAGGLASLVQSQIACESLLTLDGDSRKAWDRIVTMIRPASAHDDREDGTNLRDEVQGPAASLPDEGLAHRALVIAVDLLTYTQSLEQLESKRIMDIAVECGLLHELLGLLAGWTAPDPTMQVLPPKKDLVDATVECLRLMRAGGVDLVL